MPAQLNPWKLGLFVTIGIAAALGAVVWLGLSRYDHEVLAIRTYFDEAVDGLSVGSEVRLRGIPVGTVAGMGVAPDMKHVQVDFDFWVDVLQGLGVKQSKEEIEQAGLERSDLRVQLTRNMLTGLAYLQIDVFDPAEFPPPTYNFPTPRLTMPSVPTTMLGVQKGLAESLERIPGVLDEANSALREVEKAIQNANIQQLSLDVRELLTNVNKAVTDLDVAGLRRRLDAPLEEIDATLEDIRALVNEVRENIAPVTRLIAEYTEVGLAVRQDLRDADIPATTEALRETLDSLRRLALLIERDPSSVIFGKSAPASRPPEGNR